MNIDKLFSQVQATLDSPQESEQNLPTDSVRNLGFEGLYGHRKSEQADRFFADMRTWVGWVVDGKRPNAVLVDTTTLANVASVIARPESKDQYSAQSLWDLEVFLRAVVLHDAVFHLPNVSVDSLAINESLGADPVLIELPIDRSPSDLTDDYGDSSPQAFLRYLFDDASASYNWNLAKSEDPLDEDGELLLKDWSALVGRQVVQTDLFDPNFKAEWASYGLNLRNSLYRESDATLVREADSVGQVHLSYNLHGLNGLVDECNRRAIFNAQLAASLDIPYLGNAGRWPMGRWLARRSAKINTHLRSLRFLDAVYQQSVAAYRAPTDTVLPVLLSAALAQMKRSEDFWRAAADLRQLASRYRGLRREFDDAAAAGKAKELDKIIEALSRTDKNFSGAMLKSMVGAVGTVGGGVAKMSGKGLAPAILGLSAANKVEDPIWKEFFRRLLRPEYAALQNLAAAASQLTIALPKYWEIWEVPPKWRAIMEKEFVAYQAFAP